MLARRIQQDIDDDTEEAIRRIVSFLCPVYAESMNRQAADTTQYMVYIMIKVYFNLYFI